MKKELSALTAFIFFGLITLGIGYLASVSELEGVAIASAFVGSFTLVAMAVVPLIILDK